MKRINCLKYFLLVILLLYVKAACKARKLFVLDSSPMLGDFYINPTVQHAFT